MSVWAKVQEAVSSKLAGLTCVQKRENWWRYIDLNRKEAYIKKKVEGHQMFY